jgi:hypothetical protein
VAVAHTFQSRLLLLHVVDYPEADASPEDIEAYFYLQPLIEVEALAEIENAQVWRECFAKLVDTLQGAQVYDGIVISYIGEMDRTDMAAEMADLLLRLKGVWWALCMGVYEDVLVLAARARGRYGDAERLAQDIVQGRGTAGGRAAICAGSTCAASAFVSGLWRD